MGRSRPLDGIRAIAVLATIAIHTNLAQGRAGFLGVDIFFVLSGYLITSILLRERERTGAVSLRRFYARRALRLYPILVVLALVALVAPTLIGFADRGDAAKASGVMLGYLGDFSVHFTWPVSLGSLNQIWTLGIEEQFYLIWPIVLVLVLGRWGRRALTAVAALATVYAGGMLMALGATNGDPFAHVYFRPDLRAGAIALGCLLAILMHRREFSFPPALGWVALAALAVLLARGPAQTSALAYVIAIPATWIVSAALIAEVITSPQRPLARLLGWRPLAAVGVISYGLYLIHPIVFEYFSRHVSLARHDGVAIGIVISFALAALSYRFLESPFLRLKQRVGSAGSLEAAPRPRPMPASAPTPPSAPVTS